MKKVIIGLSGGVDSAVAAFLLQKEGYLVEGLFMRNWDSTLNNDFLGNPDLKNHSICPQEEDYNDALKVADHLGIKLHRIDFVKEYWDDVFKYFLSELKKGRTPNPDILCNKYIKFTAFKEKAFELGADFIATGHYAKLKEGKLYKAKDKNKDQTYFLSQLTKEQLDKVLFPLSDITKPEVRKIAHDNNIPTMDKKDSTGICFIGERKFKQFLHNYFLDKPGQIINIKTHEVVGTHDGLMFYTIGQRRGLDIGGTKERLFVVGKNLKDNILYVEEGENNPYLYSNGALIEDVNFNSDLRPHKCMAKFRYRAPDFPVEVTYLDKTQVYLKYNNVKAVTPGQACVFYLNDQCLGGGFIKTVYNDDKPLSYLGGDN